MLQEIVELNVEVKLRRFCFLGSLDPVYIHLKGPVNIKTYLPLIDDLCKTIDTIQLAKILSDALNDSILVRRDEAIFVYATYLAANVKEQFKNEMRIIFNKIICNDNDLFMFCKYDSLIRKERRINGFSRTVRKAIRAWYEEKTKEEIQMMWLSCRGQYNFTHKMLIKLCAINDNILGGPEVAKPFFQTCSKLLLSNADAKANNQQPDVQANGNVITENINSDSKNTKTTNTTNNINNINNKSNKNNIINEICNNNVMMAMAKLRTTHSNHEALKIIRKFKLNFNQVPHHFLQCGSIVQALVPTMTYLQLLKCCKYMSRNFHLFNNNIFRLCHEKLQDKALRKASHVEPITLLITMHKMGIRDDKNSRFKSNPFKRTHFMREIYEKSFDDKTDEPLIPMDLSQSDLRIHITMNLQNNYKEKYLKNQTKLTYYEAALSLAFSYFKNQPCVDVFHWFEERLKLQKIFWRKTMNITMAYGTCTTIRNFKNDQRLIAPIIQAMSKESTYKRYYVFICIVPTSGRGNPQHSSKQICSYLDEYREKYYSKAKFIILQLLKYRPSLKYSQNRVENILEICGLDEHTTTIIKNFVNEKFF